MSGERAIYKTERIDITIYGNTIGIVLEDYDAPFGDSKENPISYTGNELFQHSNLSEEIANSILSNYENGKETAVIKCSIGEYYDDVGNLRISTKREKPPINKDDVYYADYGSYVEFGLTDIKKPRPFDIEITYTIMQNGSAISGQMITLPKGETSVTLNVIEGEEYVLSIDEVGTFDTISSVFAIGDRVVPHIMSAQGSDAPMSQDQYGNAKVFEIVGTNIYYDGAVWQELTLQEV